MRVPHIKSPEKMEEISMGALPINPNSLNRIRHILDHIKKECGMHKKFSVKIKVEGETIAKEVIESENRSWVLLTTDGLPYKHIVDLICNHFTCLKCGKKIEHISELTILSLRTEVWFC